MSASKASHARRAGVTLPDLLVATCVALAVLGVVVLAATAALLSFVGVREDIAALSAFAAGAAVFRFLTRITRESERAAFDVGRYAALETAYLAVGFAAGVALLMRFDLGAAAPFAGLLLAGVIIALIDAPRLIARARGGAPSLERATAFASYGAPLALALALDLGVQTIARFILAHQAGVAELGAYAAAFGLARPLDIVFIGAGAAFAPLLMIAYDEVGVDAAKAIAAKAFAVFAALALPGALGLALVSEPLAALLVGQGLSASAAAAMPWLALGGVFAGFNLYYWSEAFQLTRRTGLRALAMIAPGSVQLALTFALSQNLGAVGAAIAGAAGAACGSLALALVGRRLVALPIPFGELARVCAATVLMGAGVWIAPNSSGIAALATQITLGVAGYALGVFAFDVLGVRGRLLTLARGRFPLFGGRLRAS